nr:hypothetical protein Q903MT_gene3565 [Picea sitchensis]
MLMLNQRVLSPFPLFLGLNMEPREEKLGAL